MPEKGILPLLRMQKDLDEKYGESEAYYHALEVTLRFLIKDNEVRKIFDKAESSEQPLPGGEDSVDISEKQAGSGGSEDIKKETEPERVSEDKIKE